ncbi:unnamed protein product [Hermetia illucens]|uniref:DNA repair and recombination protein RAD54-like n=1 Tax=Hermetia illucens TaxID=343691 RepID=A0A7R8USL2_HERIL|nr:DNA repair and recombination protein RAD54-like [Hermetia illucens]CAD7086283.1 unnamed protein product [Hermetia illucens]
MRRSQAPSISHSNKFKTPIQNKRPRREQKENLSLSAPIQKLSVSDYEQAIANILRKPFKVPIPNYIPDHCGNRCLGIRRSIFRRPLHDPFACNALVLSEPPKYTEHDIMHMDKNKILVHVVVDPLLSNILRAHQREGVKFMYDCVTGAKGDFQGCIMADEMGLGKTLQCVTLVWTLLRQSPECKPTISKAIIVCPSSLVKNWQNEFNKWLHGRVNCLVIENSNKEETIQKLKQYILDKSVRSGTPILVTSYESFRIYSEILNSSEVGIVICDEGHRLKNSDNQTYQALMGLQTKRRVLLSGTPIQNDLTEYYSLINFVNPDMLGPPGEFRRQYENPIARGQNADSSDKEREKAVACIQQLTSIVNKCLIRRTNQILTKYLPVKFEMIICVKMTELQKDMYKKIVNSDSIQRNISKGSEDGKMSLTALADISTLKKLCNHPSLVETKEISSYGRSDLSPELSGKVMLLDFMLAAIKANSDDKVVLVSNYTQTLDYFQKLCEKRKYSYVRLDGTMTIKKRSKIVSEFNDPNSKHFIFMLSSKAGGCGLNLIGANRLFMFDPDWNPANDDQAMARVWRDGQKKPCFIYRLLATGSIEEKIFQRQTHKKSLSSKIVDNNEDSERHFTRDDLKYLFRLEENTMSDTHDKLKCKRCINNLQVTAPPPTADCTSDLTQWFHCTNNKGVPDNVLSQAWSASKCVSFLFHQRSQGEVESRSESADNEEKEDKVCFKDDEEVIEESDVDSDDSDEDFKLK